MNDLVSNRSSPLGLFPGQAALRLYDWAMEALRRRHYSRRTEQTYLHWIRHFVEFPGGTHPRELAESDVNRFLTDLAVTENVAAPTQNQAAAVLFLYEHFLDQLLDRIERVVRLYTPEKAARCADPRRGPCDPPRPAPWPVSTLGPRALAKSRQWP